jgi:hypothetical protein
MRYYLVTAFEMLDEFLNALSGGLRNETISLRAAMAQKQGRPWGCVLCRWLHLTLRQHHCRRTLDREPMGAFAGAVAAVQLGAVFGVVFYLVPWAIWRFL